MVYKEIREEYCEHCKQKTWHEISVETRWWIYHHTRYIAIDTSTLEEINNSLCGDEFEFKICKQCNVSLRPIPVDPTFVILKSQDKRVFICENCHKSVIGYARYARHERLCKNRVYNFKSYLEEARELYKKTGTISAQQACILLNCRPAQDLVRKTAKKAEIHEKVIETAISLIKDIEKAKGLGTHLSITKIAAGSLYLACIIEGVRKSQHEIAPLFKITEPTLREGVQFIIKNVDTSQPQYHINYNNTIDEVES